MADPKSMDEYTTLFTKNQKITGHGPASTTMHYPCPFCAAPDWAAVRIIDTEEEMQKDRKCTACGRSAKALMNRTGNGVSFELVQTGGDDIPEWFVPKIRRVEPEKTS